MSNNIYHRVFNPDFESIDKMFSAVDKLNQGWVLLKIIPAEKPYAWVVVFTQSNVVPVNSEPDCENCLDKRTNPPLGNHPGYDQCVICRIAHKLKQPAGIRRVRLACPVVLECDKCPMKAHGACKDNIITGEEAITK